MMTDRVCKPSDHVDRLEELDGTHLLAEIIEHQARQRRLDDEPCPRCGGDRLRNDFTDSGRCHAATV